MRALVHSGGGSNGDWGVGVLEYLLNEEGRRYDLHVGISTGALSMSFLAQFPHGQEREATEALRGIYEGLKDNKSIYKKWFGWPLALLWKPSVYNTAPLERVVREGLSRDRLKASGKMLIVGAVEMGLLNRYVKFTENHADIVDAVLASAAYPVMFPPVKIKDMWYTDGGVRNVVPLHDAVTLGADQIDVIVCSPEYPPPVSYDAVKANVLDSAKITLSTMVDEITTNDLLVRDARKTLAKNGLPGYRHIDVRIFRPSRALGDSLAFGSDKKPSHTANMTLGREDARRIASKVGV